MRVGDTPVVTRLDLDGFIARVADHRARAAARERLFGPQGETQAIVRRVLDAGDELSREEFVAVSSIAPLLRRDLAILQVQTARDLAEARAILLRTLKRTDKLRPPYRDALRSYWRELWAVGHLSVLAAMDGPELCDELPAIAPEACAIFSLQAVEQGISAVALKGLWAASRLGTPMIQGYRSVLGAQTSWLQMLDAALGLTLLGFRGAPSATRCAASSPPFARRRRWRTTRPPHTAALAALGLWTLDEPRPRRRAR